MPARFHWEGATLESHIAMINKCSHCSALGPLDFKSFAVTPSTPGALLFLRERNAATTSTNNRGLVDATSIGQIGGW